jgi:hypothetical protein
MFQKIREDDINLPDEINSSNQLILLHVLLKCIKAATPPKANPCEVAAAAKTIALAGVNKATIAATAATPVNMSDIKEHEPPPSIFSIFSKFKLFIFLNFSVKLKLKANLQNRVTSYQQV